MIKCNDHSYRVWIDNQVGLCGKCGKFVFVKRPAKLKIWWLYFKSFVSKECLACTLIWANRKRTLLIQGRLKKYEVHKSKEKYEDEGQVMNINYNPSHFQNIAINTIEKLKYNHNWKCWLKKQNDKSIS